jgi:galactose oxidase-like protein/glyoxal oxidase-like protein
MLAGSALPWHQVASAAAIDVGSWTAPFNVPFVGIHATLLHDGTVLLFETTGSNVGSRAVILDPVTRATTPVSFNRARDVFCAGHNVMPDGDVFVTGGHPPRGPIGVGVPQTDIYRAATRTWEPGPDMGEARWYPTNVELADGTSLIFGGKVGGAVWAKTVEKYHPASQTLSVLPASATKQLPLYPRMFLLPSGSIFVAGPGKPSLFFNPATAQWKASAKRHASDGSSVLLSDLHSVLSVGGKAGSTTGLSEIIDVNAAQPKWTATAPLHHARTLLNLVTLADGKVLAVGGGLDRLYGRPVLTPELFDPATRTWKDMAPQVAPRMYHATSLLLPDGRVLSAGQDRQTAYATAVEIYSPPYLFKGPRPTIGSAPGSLGYGQGFSVATANAAAIGTVALVRAGSVTHGVDFDQRYVPLAFNASGGSLSVTSPANGRMAPPGWYMLFLVSTTGIPSVASWVHLT